ncbi:MAG: hypothetical protein E7408_05565 [Ruminococcaceae bacterium]|nr:hypothetical protein [Oscillospiraceae bacterium]
MLKKLVTLLMAVCMLAAPVCAATVAPVPSAGDAALLFSEEFTSYTTEDTVGDTANDEFWCRSNFLDGRIVDVGGNKALSVYSLLTPARTSYFHMPARLTNLDTQITSGTLVYEAKLMLPDVNPAEGEVYAGGTATLSLNYFPIYEVCACALTDHTVGDINNDHQGLGTAVAVSLNKDGISVLSGNHHTVAAKIPFTVSADRWYTVKCLVDVDNCTVDIFCDGKLIMTEAPFAKDRQGIWGVGVGPITNQQTTVPVGYQVGSGEILSVANTHYGNPYAAYYDDVKVYTVSKDDANKHIKAGFEALFNANGINSNEITLPYAGATAEWANTAGYAYATTCSAITLNSDATSVITDSSKKRYAEIIAPDIDTTGTMSFTKGKGTAAELTHSVDVKVLAGEQYLEIQPTEEGMEGYRVYENFEGYNVGAIRDNFIANGIYANEFAAFKVVDSVDGNPVRTKAVQIYHANNNTSSAPRGMVLDFPAAATQGDKAEADYVMLETNFMLPNVAPAGEAPYAGGQAVISFGEYFGGSGTLKDSVGEARTRLTITGNRGDQKGVIQAYIGNVARTAASEAKYPYFATNPHFDIQPDAWHKLRIVANLKSGQFDVYLNGKPAIIDAYFGKANLTEYVLRSVFIGVPAPSTSSPVVVPKGYLLGDGTRAEEDTTMPGNPFPVLYDNVQVSDITYDYHLQKLEEGFKTIVNNGIIASSALELPFYGNTKAADCHITYSVSSSLASVITLNVPRESASSNNGDYGKRQYMAITRGNEDVSGTFTVTYQTDFAAEESIEIPVTVKRYMKNVADFPGFEVDDVQFTKTGNKLKASVLMANGSDEGFDGVLIVSTYKPGNELVTVELFPTRISPNNALTVEGEIELGTEETVAKAFLWTLTGMRAATKGELPLN